jgi:hypothetical protein
MRRIATDLELIVLQVYHDRLDTGKPCQGFFNLVGSLQSGQSKALSHAGDMQRQDSPVGRRGRIYQFCLLATSYGRQSPAGEHEYDAGALDHELPSVRHQEPSPQPNHEQQGRPGNYNRRRAPDFLHVEDPEGSSDHQDRGAE